MIKYEYRPSCPHLPTIDLNIDMNIWIGIRHNDKVMQPLTSIIKHKPITKQESLPSTYITSYFPIHERANNSSEL